MNPLGVIWLYRPLHKPRGDTNGCESIGITPAGSLAHDVVSDSVGVAWEEPGRVHCIRHWGKAPATVAHPNTSINRFPVHCAVVQYKN